MPVKSGGYKYGSKGKTYYGFVCIVNAPLKRN